MDDRLTHIIKTIHDYCSTHNIDYVIVGGFSVLIFGRTRMTLDIDLIIDHRHLDYEDFVIYFRENGFDINLSDLEVMDQQLHGSFFEKNTMFRIDIKGVYGKNEQNSLDHALIANFNGIMAKFDNPNQLIVHKLKFGSEQDIEDALAVYFRSEELIDENLMRQFALELDVEEELKNFVEEAEDYRKKYTEKL